MKQLRSMKKIYIHTDSKRYEEMICAAAKGLPVEITKRSKQASVIITDHDGVLDLEVSDRATVIKLSTNGPHAATIYAESVGAAFGLLFTFVSQHSTKGKK
jgi:hypothetical protein